MTDAKYFRGPNGSIFAVIPSEAVTQAYIEAQVKAGEWKPVKAPPKSRSAKSEEGDKAPAGKSAPAKSEEGKADGASTAGNPG